MSKTTQEQIEELLDEYENGQNPHQSEEYRINRATAKINKLLIEARKATRRHAEIDVLVDVQIQLMQIGKTEGEQRDNALKLVNERLTTLQAKEVDKQ